MEKGRLGRYITRRHAKHHNIDYSHWYTVSPGGQLVDSALGSDPAQYGVVPNVLTCGLDPNDPRLVKSRIRFGLDSSLTNTRRRACADARGTGHLTIGADSFRRRGPLAWRRRSRPSCPCPLPASPVRCRRRPRFRAPSIRVNRSHGPPSTARCAAGRRSNTTARCGRTSISAATSSCTDPTIGAPSSTVKRWSSGAARKPPWQAVFFANDGDAFTDSSLDPLGATNTPFSLVEPERRLSQPTIRATAFFEGLSVDVYALIGRAAQPLPDSDGRLRVRRRDLRRRRSGRPRRSGARGSGLGYGARPRLGRARLWRAQPPADVRARNSRPTRSWRASMRSTPRSCRSAASWRRRARTGAFSAEGFVPPRRRST